MNDLEQAIEFRQEFFEYGVFVINGSELFDKMDDYAEWCRTTDANTKEETVNLNWVITDAFFAVDDDRIVGIIDFRHTLNDFLKDLGHCGYSVRPSERRKIRNGGVYERSFEIDGEQADIYRIALSE